MKKQTLSTTLIVLCASALLSACPQQSSSVTEPPPSGAPLTQLATFPSGHLACCWDALQKSDATYAATALSALNGDLEALEKLIGMSKTLELTPGYAHGAVLAEVLQRVGDERFAWVIAKLDKAGTLKENQSLFEEKLNDTLRNLLEGGFALNTEPSVHDQSLKAFPKTAAALKYVVEAKVAATK